MYERVFNGSSFSSGAGLSSRTDNRLPYPRSKNPEKIQFPDIFPEQIEVISDGSKYSIPRHYSAQSRKRQYRKPNPRSDLNDVA